MRSSLLLLSTAVALAVGCNDQPTGPTPGSNDNHIVISSGDPGASASIDGHVFGVDTASGGAGHPDLAGIPIEVYEMVPGVGLPDSAGQTPMVEQLAGTGTSGSDGKFSVTGIPPGQYVVYAKPGAASPWHSTSGYTMASDGHSNTVIELGLYPKSVVSGE